MDVATDFTIKLHVPLRGHVADDGEVLANYRFPHGTHSHPELVQKQTDKSAIARRI
jgi:hypothetical protein